LSDELKVGIKVELDTSDLANKIHQGADKALKGNPLVIPTSITTDLSSIRKSAESIRDLLQAKLGTITVTPKVDTTQATQAVKNVEQSISTASQKISAPTKMSVDTSAVRKATEDIGKLQQRLKESNNKFVTSKSNAINGILYGATEGRNKIADTSQITSQAESVRAELLGLKDSIADTTGDARQHILNLIGDLKALVSAQRKAEKDSVTGAQRTVDSNASRIEQLNLAMASSKTTDGATYNAALKEQAVLIEKNRQIMEQYGGAVKNVSFSDKYISQIEALRQESIRNANQIIAGGAGNGITQSDLQSLNGKVVMAAAGDASPKSIAALNAEMTKLAGNVKQYKIAAKDAFNSNALSTDIEKTKSQFDSLGRKWSNLFSDNGLKQKYNAIRESLNSITDADGYANAKRQISEFKSEVEAAGLNAKTLGDRWQDAVKKFGGWLSAASVVMGVVNVVKQMTASVVELDGKITDLQIASGKSRAEVSAMVAEYAQMGKALGATAVDVASAADTFLRQGKSIAETNQLIKDATMLSKLGQIDAAESSTALTSAMKGYQIETADAIKIVDKLTAIDMQASISAGDLAIALSQTATSAKLSGLELSKLLGQLAVVGEVTQDAPESVGNFYKTLLARMQNIKAGELVDPESSESLSDVEVTLSGLGIKLRDSQSEFRNMGDVLDETARKWDSFSSVQQRAVAVAFSGTRQQEKFRRYEPLHSNMYRKPIELLETPNVKPRAISSQA